jgi:pyruvate/2-oxoglutarate dehydrogenase complex dihydrolipoamide dehydrogenase (E3) component
MAAMIDDNDRRLVAQVRPAGFRTPSPASKYDLVVVGGGTAGLVCAAGAAGLGARVALVEQSRLGGDCLNTGCVPSKALLRSARVVGEARVGAALGVRSSAQADFTAVMSRLRARRADLAGPDSAQRLASLGVDLFFGSASFSGPGSVSVALDGGNVERFELRFRKAVIATGSRPAVPSIPGLVDTPYLTNESVFDLTVQPGELAVVGGGPSGCELAQAFARLGTHVTLFDSGRQLLPREDGDAAALVEARLRQDGVEVLLRTGLASARCDGGQIFLTHVGGALSVDALLVAAGRSPRLDGLRLEAAGIEYSADGVTVDDRLRTSNPRVYAAGDVCSKYKFTHAADAMARIVVRNALFFGRSRVSSLVIPWCTFTSPEVGHVGESGAEAAGRSSAAVTIPLSSVDRAVVDEATDGFVRVYHRQGRITGATVVAPNAGEVVSAIALAMNYGGSLSDLSTAVFPYPTMSIALRQAGDAYRRSALTPRVRRVLQYYFSVLR